MKKFLSIILIICFFLSVCLIAVPQSAKAQDRPLRGIFVDTMFGLLTGSVIAAAVTLTDSDAKSDDWGRNLGTGAAIGALAGVGIGLATEAQSIAYFDGQQLSFHVPVPRLSKLSSSESSPMVSFNVLNWCY